MRTSTGVVKSPRFPLNYPDDVDCEWKIRVEEGSRIKLTFIRFEVLAEFHHTGKYRGRRHIVLKGIGGREGV